MSKIIANAVLLAYVSHDGQVRKYNGKPYISHPIRVASAFSDHPLADECGIAAAYCHDLIEDTPQTYGSIVTILGKRTADIVLQLTNPSKGLSSSRAERKLIDREFLAKAEPIVKVIKMFDRTDNLIEMVGADVGFKRLYAEESLSLLEVIGDADNVLAERLRHEVDQLLLTCNRHAG